MHCPQIRAFRPCPPLLRGPGWLGIDEGIPPLVHGGDVAPLAGIVAAFFAAIAVQAVTTRAFIVEIGRFGEGVVRELRGRLFAHFQRLPVAFHERYTSGRVISRQTSDIDSLSDLFEEGLDSLVSAVFSLLLVGAGMLLLDWPLALVVLAGFVPLTVLTLWFRRESATAYRHSREAIAGVIVHFVETFGGIRAVQAFRREGRNAEIFSVLNGRYATASLRSMRLVAVYSPGITLIGNLATGAVLLYGGLRVADGDIKVGVLATFLLYLQRFFDPLQDLSQFYNTFQSAGAALEKISGVLDEPPTVPEPAAPAQLPARQGSASSGPTTPRSASSGPTTPRLLDIPSERAVQTALRSILTGRTALIIAHRLSTVAIADRVLVMSAGRIVEDGPPGLLLAGNGRYSALYASWRSSLS
jgi:ATP-binding cassette, subfamily B, bacterial